MTTYTLDDTAIFKILLHAARYPSLQISGLLLSNIDSPSTRITDCIPLFHSSIGYASCMEIALLTISAWCKQQSLKIVGYYEADESLNPPSEVSTIGKRAGDKILENCKDNACIVVLDNSKMEGVSQGGQDLLPLICFEKSEGSQWSKKGNLEHSVSKLSVQYMQLLASQKHLQIVDFDEHLDNVDSDWTNEGLLDIDEKESNRKYK
eukprot:TRINITY_DN39581_c0_g2_i1.p3 TRINITY_DN39581_c0_g2~~TRINITY_DN39581_c0_g2_i1.p3  ORF type:complete len:223 (+),score=22.33 TRINITY_DN39581_c0_g2_i1:50-670(+)